MQTNHLSHFLLTKELFPLLLRAAELHGQPARVVNHSSMARSQAGKPLLAEYMGKNGDGNLGGNGNSMMLGGACWVRYQQTKLANSVFTEALKVKLAAAGNTKIIVATAAPGFATTNLQVTTMAAGGMGSGNWFMRMAQSAEDGTMPLLAACFSPNTESGDFWEPGHTFHTVGPAVKVPLDKQSANPDNAKLLWELSEKAVGTFDVT
jgi:NAD(P)-dependent dehydrogenase (short-subunit alcohol dehydrogenase family)